MALPSLYDKSVTEDIINRINKLTPDSQPLWGTMDVSKMLAHCCITYEYIFEERHDKPNFLMKFMLKAFVKNAVVSETPYKHNERTGPAFIIANEREFEKEKARLLNYINKVVENGESFFRGKKSVSFDELTPAEWNNMMYKHLDHHLRQFGV
jgi:hypothetical protein